VPFADITLSDTSTEYGFLPIEKTSPDKRIGGPTSLGVKTPVDIGVAALMTVVLVVTDMNTFGGKVGDHWISILAAQSRAATPNSHHNLPKANQNELSGLLSYEGSDTCVGLRQ